MSSVDRRTGVIDRLGRSPAVQLSGRQVYWDVARHGASQTHSSLAGHPSLSSDINSPGHLFLSVTRPSTPFVITWYIFRQHWDLSQRQLSGDIFLVGKVLSLAWPRGVANLTFPRNWRPLLASFRLHDSQPTQVGRDHSRIAA